MVPYGINIDNICIDQNRSQNAMRLYNELFYHRFTIRKCLYPCKFIKTFVTGEQLNDWDSKSLFFQFNRFIKTSKSQYSYGLLELLAEFGGYVGLFLGISVFQLKDGFNKLFYFIFEQ